MLFIKSIIEMKNSIILMIMLFSFSVLCVLKLNNYTYDENYSKVHPDLKRTLLLTQEVIDNYRLAFDNILKKYDFKGNMLIAINGISVFESSTGFAHMHSGMTNNLNTTFQLASISKTFTAAAVVLLRDKNMLKLEDFVSKYIPEFPYPDITIKHLLNHTSGLPNYIWLLEHEWKKKYFPDNEDLIFLLAKHKLPLNFIPGQRFSYSNTGYAVLGSLIQRISGKKYEVFLKEYIFEPLKMETAFVYNQTSFDTIDNVARGYVRRGRGYVEYEHDANDGVVGDKGIYASIYDLFKWDLALHTEMVFSNETINEIFEIQKTNRDRYFNYALGWRLPAFIEPKMVFHNGWWHGFRTSLRRYVNDKNTIIVLNNTNTNIFPMLKEIQLVLYPEIEEELY